MQNLQLFSIWEAERNQNTYIKHHSHKYHELVYYARGNGKTEIEGKKFCFLDGSFVIIPPDTEHDELHYADANVICLMFSGVDNFQIGFFEDSSNKIGKILNELLNEAHNQKYNYREMFIVKLNELMLNISRIKHITNDTKSFEYIINYIIENFHEQLNLSECAKQLNISYDYFQHKFKSLTGLSPKQFLMQQRLLSAEKMLKQSNYNCTEISCRCGFSTSAQFSALFKNRYGITPMQYRKQLKQT